MIEKIEELLGQWQLQELDYKDVDENNSYIGIDWKLYPTKSYTGFSQGKIF